MWLAARWGTFLVLIGYPKKQDGEESCVTRQKTATCDTKIKLVCLFRFLSLIYFLAYFLF